MERPEGPMTQRQYDSTARLKQTNYFNYIQVIMGGYLANSRSNAGTHLIYAARKVEYSIAASICNRLIKSARKNAVKVKELLRCF